MASKRVFRVCKLQGLSLRADALQKLTEELTKYGCIAPGAADHSAGASVCGSNVSRFCCCCCCRA